MSILFPIIRGRRSPPRLGDGRDANLSPGLLQAEIPSLSAMDAFLDTFGGSTEPSFFISPTGDDNSGNGTIINPWKTPGKARDEMRAPGALKVTTLRNGVYSTSSVVNLTSQDSGITFKNRPGETPIIDMGGGVFNAFNLTGADDIVFKGLRLQNSTGTNNAGQVDGSEACIRLDSSVRVIIESCVFDSVWQAVALRSNSDNFKFLGNTLNAIAAAAVSHYGIIPGQGSIVAGNTFTDIGIEIAGFQIWQGHCLQMNRPKNAIIEYNVCSDVADAFMSGTGMASIFSGSGNNLIQYNHIKRTCKIDNDYGAIFITGRDGGGAPSDTIVQFNRIEDVGGGVIPGEDASVILNIGIYLDDEISGVIVRNNFVKNCTFSSFQIHGGKNNLITSNVGIVRNSRPGGATTEQENHEQFMFYQSSPEGSAIGGIAGFTGNVIDKNIIFSVDDNGDQIAFVSPEDQWMFDKSGAVNPTVIMENMTRFEDIKVGVVDSSTETNTPGVNDVDPQFTDPDNEDWTLAVGSQAYTNGFTDVPGVTDGGATVIGIAGYDRSNYVEVNVQLPAFFVAKDGDDTDGTTEAKAFRTLPQARNAMRSDPTRIRTYIRAGTYNISSDIALTSSDANTSYLAYPGETPVLDGQGRTGSIFNGNSSGVDDITWKGLELQNLTESTLNRVGAIVLNFSSGITIEECNIHDVNTGIWHNGAGESGWKILGNTVTDTIDSCIFWENAPADSFIAGNVLTRPGGPNLNTKRSALHIARGADNMIIEYNDISECNYQGIEITDGGSSPSTNLRCRYNIVERYLLARGYQFDEDGGGIYIFGRGLNTGAGPHTGAQIHDNWVGDCSPDEDVNLGMSMYLDDAAAGVSVQNNIWFKSGTFSVHMHGTKDCLVENNLALIREGTGAGHPFQDSMFMRYQEAVTHNPNSNTGGNMVKKNIMIPVDVNLVRISYTASTSADDWRSVSGSMLDPTIQDNALGRNIAVDADETSSTQFDSRAAGPNNGGFKTYDPANKILTLNKISRGDAADHPAYAEGFVDIIGITDGAPFFWGTPSGPAGVNSGYDRDNY